MNLAEHIQTQSAPYQSHLLKIITDRSSQGTVTGNQAIKCTKSQSERQLMAKLLTGPVNKERCNLWEVLEMK